MLFRSDRGNDGEPRHVVEVRYEGEEELRPTEHEHVVASVEAAGRVVPVRVVAVGLQNRPAAWKTIGLKQRHVLREHEKEGKLCSNSTPSHMILARWMVQLMQLLAGGDYLMLVVVVMVYATLQPYRLRYCSELQARVCFLPE